MDRRNWWAIVRGVARIRHNLSTKQGFPGGAEVKASACNVGDPGSIPGSGRSRGEQMATHSSVLAWRIPGMEEPGGLQSTGHKELNTTELNNIKNK